MLQCIDILKNKPFSNNSKENTNQRIVSENDESTERVRLIKNESAKLED